MMERQEREEWEEREYCERGQTSECVLYAKLVLWLRTLLERRLKRIRIENSFMKRKIIEISDCEEYYVFRHQSI